MRLLHVRDFVLHEFFEPGIPPYAILSHRWEEEEILFKDVQFPGSIAAVRHLKGYSKVLCACYRAMHDGYTYVWIDTCCIDKSSSSELSEAINSMFRWYSNSQICYAYLSDIAPTVSWNIVLDSVWFTRGWTLQELIAPRRLVFYDCSWGVIEERNSISALLSDRLHIPETVLKTNDIQVALRGCCAAQKMSWASRRQTTRIEDQAYCLLGIFDVTLPFLYGEGPGAFMKLQEEILKSGNDLSILAWNDDARGRHSDRRLFATSPAQFHNCGDIVAALPFPDMAVQDTIFTINKGLEIKHPPIIAFPKQNNTCRYALSLGCRNTDDPHGVLALKIQTTESIQMLNQQVVSNRRTYFAGWDIDNMADYRLIRERFNTPSFSDLLPDLTISKQRVIDKMNYRQAFIAPHEYLWFLLPVLRPRFAWQATNFFPRGDWDQEALACSLVEEKRSRIFRRKSRSFRAFALQNDQGESLAVYLKFGRGMIQFSLAAYDAFTFPVFNKDSFRKTRDRLDVSKTCSVEILPYDTRQSGKLVRQLQIRVHRKGLDLTSDVFEIGTGTVPSPLHRRATLPAYLKSHYDGGSFEVDGQSSAAAAQAAFRSASHELDSGWLPHETMALSRSVSDTAAVLSRRNLFSASTRQCLVVAHRSSNYEGQTCQCYRPGLARFPSHSSVQMSDGPPPASYHVTQSPHGPWELDSIPVDQQTVRRRYLATEDDWRSPACIAIWYRTILPSNSRAWEEFEEEDENNERRVDIETQDT